MYKLIYVHDMIYGLKEPAIKFYTLKGLFDHVYRGYQTGKTFQFANVFFRTYVPSVGFQTFRITLNYTDLKIFSRRTLEKRFNDIFQDNVKYMENSKEELK